MSAEPDSSVDDVAELASPASLAWALGGVAVGATLALVVLPDVVPALVGSLSGPQPKTWWYMARTTGLVAYALMSTSMVLGLLLSTKFAKRWPGSAQAFVLHEHASVLGLAFALFHAIVLLGDRHTPFTWTELVLPFGAAYRPFALGMGQLAVYGMALLVGSFYLRKRLGQRSWRLLHFTSFAVFALALAHGLVAGTDRAIMLAGAVPVAAVVFFGAYRVLWHLHGGVTAPAG